MTIIDFMVRLAAGKAWLGPPGSNQARGPPINRGNQECKAHSEHPVAPPALLAPARLRLLGGLLVFAVLRIIYVMDSWLTSHDNSDSEEGCEGTR